jgi:hypothetical protein
MVRYNCNAGVLNMSETLLTQEEVDEIQQRLGTLSAFCGQDLEFYEKLSRYVSQSKSQWDGTLDVIILQRMSRRQMEQAQVTLKFLYEIGLRCLQIADLRAKLIEEQ